MRDRLPRRLPLLLLVLLAPLLAAGPIMFVRNSGDRMWGALTINAPGNADALVLAQDDFLAWLNPTTGAVAARVRNGSVGGSRSVENGDWYTGLAYRATGIAAASLPTGATVAGGVTLDTTNSAFRATVDGTTWRYLVTSGSVSGGRQSLYSSHFYNSKTVATESATETSLTFTASSTPRVQCTPVLVGVGAGNAVVSVRKNGSTQFSVNVACTTAVGTNVSSTGTGFAIAAGDDIGLRVDGTACSTFPELMCHLEVYEP